MPKNYFQGAGPSNQNPPQNPGNDGERSIRNIPITTTRQNRPPVAPQTPLRPSNFSAPSGSGMRRSFRGRFALWAVAAAALTLLAFVGFLAFRPTSVVVTPRVQPIALPEEIGISAYPERSDQAALGNLTYAPITKTYDAEASVAANGFTEVTEYASGAVTVYNEHGSAPVRLIKNTRFESTDGHVFRIRNSIVVPGKRGASPGTITATVYADAPGDAYNVAAGRFTLPGLKGGDMYEHVYARSTAAMAGGFSGAKPKVSETDVARERDKLHLSLEEKARTEARDLAAPGVVIFPSLLQLSFEPLPLTQGTDGQAVLHERLNASIPTFPEKLFARVLATATHTDVGDAGLRLIDPSKLSVRAISQNAASQQTVDIMVSGSASLIFEVDLDALRKALAGIPKVSFESTIAGINSIGDARAYVRPFWRKTFPADPNAISIRVEQPTQ